MNDDQKITPGGVILGWWSARIDAEHGAARKARAGLKRAAMPAEALAHEAVHNLNTLLHTKCAGWNLRGRPKTLALIAATLAGIETNDRQALPRKLGLVRSDRRALSEMRFQKIIRADDPWMLAVRLRRALPMAGKACNVTTLGNDLFYWGDDVRNRWCFDYFGSKPPSQLETADSEDA